MVVGLVLALAGLVLVLRGFHAIGWIRGWPGGTRETVFVEPVIPDEERTVWTKAAVYLREAPADDAETGTLIRVSTAVRQVAQHGSWSLVETLGEEPEQGYLPLQYLTMLEPLSRASDVLEDVQAGLPLTRAQQTELLAHLIYSESGNQSRLCQLYTGSVVLNRAGGDPDRLEEVIFRPGAFDVVPNRMILKEPSQLARTVASELMAYGSNLPEYVLYFHRYDTDNAWTRQLEVYVQEDEVVFAYWPGDEE